MRSHKLMRDELKFITDFGSLFEVLQQVALSKLNRAEEYVAGQPRIKDVLAGEFLTLLPASARQDPLVRGGKRGEIIVVITSDYGMVGPLYTDVIRKALTKAKADTQWIFVGGRGLRLLGERVKRTRWMSMPPEEKASEQIYRLSQAILSQFKQEALHKVWLVSPHFISSLHQEVAMQQLLPLPWYSSAGTEDKDLIVEPQVTRVVERLAALWVEYVCLEALWSARLAEFAARALHMEEARDELAKQHNRLRYEFFKAMHEKVDVIVRETCVVQRLSERRKERQARTMRGN